MFDRDEAKSEGHYAHPRIVEWYNKVIRPVEVAIEEHKLALDKKAAKGFDPYGREQPDPTPVAPPVGFLDQPSLIDQIRSMVRSEFLRQHAQDEGDETFEESDDFEIGDDDELGVPISGFEYDPDLDGTRTGGVGGEAPDGSPPPAGVDSGPEAPPAEPAPQAPEAAPAADLTPSSGVSRVSPSPAPNTQSSARSKSR